MDEDNFPLAVQHKGFRFKVKSERDAMQLLLIMVRDGVCSVDKAMECLVFDERTPSSATCSGEKP